MLRQNLQTGACGRAYRRDEEFIVELAAKVSGCVDGHDRMRSSISSSVHTRVSQAWHFTHVAFVDSHAGCTEKRLRGNMGFLNSILLVTGRGPTVTGHGLVSVWASREGSMHNFAGPV